MVQFGYKLMSETTVRSPWCGMQAGPRMPVSTSFRLSDHFIPWLESHGHSPFAWSVLGAIAAGTDRVGVDRVDVPDHSLSPDDRRSGRGDDWSDERRSFTLALGLGERLNEHVVGQGWPAVHRRHAMLREAVAIIRLLWRGETCSHQGEFYHLDSARLYDLPREAIPIVIGVSGEKSTRLAGEVADGIMSVEPKRELIEQWQKAGGAGGPRYGELALGYANSKRAGLELVHKYMRFGALDWSVLSELPNVGAFEAATKFVRPEDLRDEVPHGPDVEAYVEAIRKFVDAGFDHIVLLAIGDDQEAFIRFFETKTRGSTAQAQALKP